MDSLHSSETNLVIVTNKTKFKIFLLLYWKIILFLTTPILMLPVFFIGVNNAYPCFYLFLVSAVYWTTDVAHPAVIALSYLALSTFLAFFGIEIITSIYLTSALLDCLGVMLIIVAIEHSNIHKRVALKILIIFGCSHYKISFFLFFTTMFLSMWISNVVSCGLMIPLMKIMLLELEKLGIVEMYIDKNRSSQQSRKPTVFTSFYFLGIAYSSSIGGMATLYGSRTNQIFKSICETTFPIGPKIEFPQFMLLNLPAVLLMETLVYLWLNFYFLGMFRSYHHAPLQMSMTEEEAKYINTLLSARYRQLRKLTFHEAIVVIIVTLASILQITSSSMFKEYSHDEYLLSHMNLMTPAILGAVLLFLMPINLDFVRFFKKHGNSEPLPIAPTRSCLTWDLVMNEIPWSVLFVIAGSNAMFEVLKHSKMTQEMEEFLMLFSKWPAPAFVLIIIVFCKTLTEFACNSTVTRVLLPHIAKVCVMSKVNPHYMMLAATLSISVPFHLMTGTPSNAMVLAYVHIPPRSMLRAGIGPSIISMVIIWFTVTMWSKAIWTEINIFPKWADVNTIT